MPERIPKYIKAASAITVGLGLVISARVFSSRPEFSLDDGARLSPDREHAAYVKRVKNDFGNDYFGLFVMDKDGKTKLVDETTLDGILGIPSWLPDGRTLIYSKTGVAQTFGADQLNPKYVSEVKVANSETGQNLTIDYMYNDIYGNPYVTKSGELIISSVSGEVLFAIMRDGAVPNQTP